jgi:membrane protease YdiL (CAAX protease family)
LVYWKKTLITILSILLTFFMVLYLVSYFKLLNISLNKISFLNIGFILYLLHSTLQEFVVKGVLQTSIYNFYGYINPTLSIFLSSFLFGMIHVHFGVLPILITFSFGVVLGYLYHIQKNIFGISILHGVMGWVAFCISMI